MSATEYVVLVDDQDREIGVEEKLYAHKQNLLHRAFSIFVFRKNPHLELLLTQRAMDKYHSQGLWTNTCCSHPRAGESILQAGQRRLQEELGFTTELSDLGWFQYNAHFENGLSENEIDHVLVGVVAAEIKIVVNPEEVHDARWIDLEKLENELEHYPEKFTPWLKPALDVVLRKNQVFPLPLAGEG